MVRLPLAKRNGICAGSTDEPNSPQPMAGALEHRSFSSYDKLLLYTAFAKLLWRDLSQPVWKSFILFSLSEKNKILSLVCSEVRFLCLYVKAPHVRLVEPEKNSHLDKDLNFTGLFCTLKRGLSNQRPSWVQMPWTWCKREKVQTRNGHFPSRWHLEGSGIWSGTIVGIIFWLWKKRGNRKLKLVFSSFLKQKYWK